MPQRGVCGKFLTPPLVLVGDFMEGYQNFLPVEETDGQPALLTNIALVYHSDLTI